MMLKLCVAVLASTTAAQGSIDLLDFSQLGCIRAVPEDIALVEFSLENSTLLSNNLGGQGGKHANHELLVLRREKQLER